MALASLKSLAYDDEEQWDRKKGMPDGYEPPEYPGGCCFSLPLAELERAGGQGKPGDTMRFSAMGEVTSIYTAIDDCRIELCLNEFAGEDGKFFELTMSPHICLTQAELGKIDLEADCERGDMIHLIGTARLESVSDSEFGGQVAALQVTELTYAENESDESREG